MAKPLTKKEWKQIDDLLPTGKSCRDIAEEVGRSPDTVSRRAKKKGHIFGRINAERACEARKWYCAESRAKIAARLEEEANLLIDDLHKPFIAFNFGGKENDYNEHHFDEPPTEAKFTIMRAVQSAIRTVTDIVKVDASSSDGAQNQIAEYRNALDDAAKVWEEEEPEPCES